LIDLYNNSLRYTVADIFEMEVPALQDYSQVKPVKLYRPSYGLMSEINVD